MSGCGWHFSELLEEEQILNPRTVRAMGVATGYRNSTDKASKESEGKAALCREFENFLLHIKINNLCSDLMQDMKSVGCRRGQQMAALGDEENPNGLRQKYFPWQPLA